MLQDGGNLVRLVQPAIPVKRARSVRQLAPLPGEGRAFREFGFGRVADLAQGETFRRHDHEFRGAAGRIPKLGRAPGAEFALPGGQARADEPGSFDPDGGLD